MPVSAFPLSVAPRPRAFLRVAGPEAESFLQRLVSNDVATVGVGEACDALLLTSKARVIAPVRIARRAEDDFLLLTEPELGERVQAQLTRFRLSARVEIAPEQHESHLLLGEPVEPPDGALALPTDEYGVPGIEVVDAPGVAEGASALGEDELERLRIRAGTPRYGLEIDDRVLPAEAGLVERMVSFTKGCYPGQEPIARLHYRGHANRTLRVLAIDGEELPPYDAELRVGDKVVGRVTSAAREPGGLIVALAYVRREVPDDAEFRVGTAIAGPLH